LWANPESNSRFLERACACGYKILCKLESHAAEVGLAYRLFQAIFRNRQLGHFPVTRGFENLWDFFEFDARRRRVTLLTPGYSTEQTEMRGGESPKATAVRQILSTFPPGTGASPSGIIKALQQAATVRVGKVQGGEPSVVRIDCLPNRGVVDLAMVDGLERPDIDLYGNFRKVCGALIDGPCYIDEERTMKGTEEGEEKKDEAYEAEVRRFRKAYSHFLRRMTNAMSQRSASDFDQWLRVECQHGFRRLIGHEYDAVDAEWRCYPELTPRTMFRLLLWTSSQMVARCYGALMLVAWLDFANNPQLHPSPAEQVLFRQLHAPQLYLAGLPLAFLGRPQLRWIASPLLDLWNREAFEPNAYDPLTDLLGIYGILAESRRLADRRLKQAKGKPEMQLEAANLLPARDSGAELIDKPPLLMSTQCSACGNTLRPQGVTDPWPPEWFVAEFYCPGCGVPKLYRVPRGVVE
jgi:hypothetical protein